MLQRCGLVISCRSRISPSVRFLPSSSSSCASRKVIHVNVTRTPSDPWVAQQLREATPYGERPRYLIRDNDRTFGPNFARMATTSGIKVLRTPYRTPRPNAVCERFLGSVRRECLDHFLIFHEKQSPSSSQDISGLFQSGPTTSVYSATASRATCAVSCTSEPD